MYVHILRRVTYTLVKRPVVPMVVREELLFDTQTNNETKREIKERREYNPIPEEFRVYFDCVECPGSTVEYTRKVFF